MRRDARRFVDRDIGMDILSVLGICLALLAIGYAHLLDGGSLFHLINLSAFLVVIGGSLGAVMLQTPWTTFKRFCKIFRWVLLPPKYDNKSSIKKIFSMAKETRKRGLLVLEDISKSESDPFIKKAVLLIADAYTSDELRNALLVELETEEQRDLEAAKIFDSMGGYSPTIGISSVSRCSGCASAVVTPQRRSL